MRRIADWCSIDMVDDASAACGTSRSPTSSPRRSPSPASCSSATRPTSTRRRDRANVALRTGESELYAEITPDLLERAGADEEQVQLIRDLGMSSAMVVPLRARDRVLGALTLIATTGRPDYGADDVAFAEQIAARAAIAVDNARLYREAREQQRRSAEARALLDTLIDQAPIGVGFFDREGRYVRVNDALADVNGVPAADHIGRRVEEVLPEIGGSIRAHIEQALAGGAPVADSEVARPRPDGTLNHFLVSYYPVRLAGGEALGVGVTVPDITARVRDAQELRAQRDLYEALLRAQSELGEAFALVEGERIVFVNEATERLSGRSAAELYALESVFDARAAGAAALGRIAAARRRRRGRAARARVRDRDPAAGRDARADRGGRPAAAGRGGLGRLVIIARDITERHHQEAERERLLRTEQAARRASEAAHARVRLLADASALLERSMSDEESLQDVAELLVAQLSDAAMIDVLGRDGRIRRLGAASKAPGGDRAARAAWPRATASSRRRRASDPAALREQQAASSTTRPSATCATSRDDARAARAASARRPGRSLAVVPLVARGRSVGALSVGWQTARAAPGARRVEPHRGARPAHRARGRLRRCSTRSARTSRGRCSRACCPARCRAIPGADLAAEYVAAGEGMEVGGDFFDVFAVGEQDEWALVIGDVCGKGAEAAAVTALARYTLRAVSSRSPSPVRDARDAQRGDAAPDARAALPHRGARPPRRRARAAAGGSRSPPAATMRRSCCARTARPRSPSAAACCSASSPTPAPSTARSSSSRATRSCSTPTASARRAPTARCPPARSPTRSSPSLADGAAAIARRAVEIAEEHAGGPLRDDVAVLVLRMTER